MDPPQLGESSRSPRHHVNGDTPNTADVDDTPIDIKMSKLILPKWNGESSLHHNHSRTLVHFHDFLISGSPTGLPTNSQ